MEFQFTHFMVHLSYINKIFGVPYFRKNSGFILNVAHFVVVLLWFFSCAISLYQFSEIEAAAKSFRMVVLFLNLCTTQITPLCYLVIFHVALRKKSVDKLINMSSQTYGGNANFISYLYSRRFPIVFLGLSWLLGQTITMYGRIWTDLYHGSSLYESSCEYISDSFSTIVIIQFYCWTLVLGCSFQQLEKKLHGQILLLENNSELPSCRELLMETISQMQMILKLKEKVVEVYGTCIYIKQISCYNNLIVSLFGSMFLKTTRQRTYFSLKSLHYLLSLYIPHLIGQLTINKVSFDIKLLN